MSWRSECNVGLVLAVLAAPGLACAAEFGAPIEWAKVADKRITESSGIAAATQADLVWTNVDGPSGRFFLLDSSGMTRGAFVLKGVQPIDCEDLAPFRIGEKSYLLIADVGDNHQVRSHYNLWLIEEPAVTDLVQDPPAKDPNQKAKKKKDESLTEVDVIGALRFSYPDGSHNCEAMAIDVAERTIFVTTKEQDRGCSVYKIPLPLDATGKLLASPKPVVAFLVAKLDVPTITGGAISPDGGRFVLNGRSSLFEFVRNKQSDGAWEAWQTTLARKPAKIKKPQQEQGEAVGFARDGHSLFLSSEGKQQPIWLLPTKVQP